MEGGKAGEGGTLVTLGARTSFGRDDACATGYAAAADGGIDCAFVLRLATGTGTCGRELTLVAGRVAAEGSA